MRNILLLITFFVTAPTMLIVTTFLFSYQIYQNQKAFPFFSAQKQVAYAALPTDEGVLGASIDSTDRRISSLESFFRKYHSPLLPYASRFIQAADANGLDYCLVPAIAFQESLDCVKALSSSPYNCYGWGITKHKILTFNSYEDGIDKVSSGLAKRATITPEEIGKWYNPTNTNNWAENVTLAIDHCHQSL